MYNHPINSYEWIIQKSTKEKQKQKILKKCLALSCFALLTRPEGRILQSNAMDTHKATDHPRLGLFNVSIIESMAEKEVP